MDTRDFRYLQVSVAFTKHSIESFMQLMVSCDEIRICLVILL